MSDTTKIEWADSTFNPWIGCTKVSTAGQGGGGCDHCYAEQSTPVRVFRGKGTETWGPGAPRQRTSPANWQQPRTWNQRWFLRCEDCGWRGDRPARLGDVAACPRVECASIDLRLTRRRVFCASLADVFDNEVDPAWRVDLFQLIADTPNLDWLLLTKRIGNAARMIDEASRAVYKGGGEPTRPWPNVWLGATVVNQREADRDVPKLLTTPAAVRFVSIEPMLGPIDLTNIQTSTGAGVDVFSALEYDGAPDDDVTFGTAVLDWVIAGGESGPRARRAHPGWFRSLRDQCKLAGMPFLFKQNGEWVSVSEVAGAGEHFTFPDGAAVRRTGKKLAGRTLDGVEHNGFPRGAA